MCFEPGFFLVFQKWEISTGCQSQKWEKIRSEFFDPKEGKGKFSQYLNCFFIAIFVEEESKGVRDIRTRNLPFFRKLGLYDCAHNFTTIHLYILPLLLYLCTGERSLISANICCKLGCFKLMGTWWYIQLNSISVSIKAHWAVYS